MEEIAILDVLRRRLWLIVALAVIATVAGYAGSFLLPTKYTATSLVLVRPHQDVKMDSRISNKEFLDFPMGQANIETPSKTYIEIIKSPALIGQLVRQLDLDKVETKKGFFSRHMPAVLKPYVESAKKFVKEATSLMMYGRIIPKNNFADAVKAVQDNLALEAHSETYIFSIKYTAKEPDMAAKVANSIAKLFINYMDQLRQSEGRYDLKRLGIELDKRRHDLESARASLEAFKKKHSIFRYETEYDSQLKVLANLQTELAKLNETSAGLAAVTSKNNLSTSSVSLDAKRESVTKQLEEMKAKLKPLPELERQLNRLKLTEKVALNALDTVEKEYQEKQIKDAYAARDVQLVADAVPPQLPSGPRRLIFALVALLSATVIGVGLAFLMEYLNRKIRSVSDVEEVVGIRVLATIPRVPLAG